MQAIPENNVLDDLDMFFYYGQNELELETRHDLLSNIMQSKRSLFYNRALDSAGIDDYENRLVGTALQINMRYDIVDSISKRNQFVSNGENFQPDRRVAISQSTIRIESKDGQNVQATILYIPLADFRQTENLQIRLTP